MNDQLAAAAFFCLGHEMRVRVLRLLVRAGREGLNVGTLGSHFDIPASTLAYHLGTLVKAGLVTQERVGRQIISRADFDAVGALSDYFTNVCCLGVPARTRDAALEPVEG